MADRRDFIKKVSIGTLGIGVLSTFPYCQNVSPKINVLAPFEKLPRSTPEQQGISSSGIRKFLEAVNKSEQEFHGFMLIRNGHVVSEGWWSPFASELKHTLYSLSKSYNSTAVGMVVDDGKVTVEDSVISYFPEDTPKEISEHLKAMKIKHLLTMNTGHAEKPHVAMLNAEDGNWPKAFLAQEVTYEPGTHFLYNTGASYMLSAIVQKVTGQTVFDFLSERLFKPLNIVGADWETDPRGVTVAGYGLRVRTEDIAKLGQLYLQKGNWNGEQLISEHWVEEATKKQTTSQEGDNDWAQGYGYQFWRCKPAPGFYRGDGAFGQYCIVIPQKNTVIAINSESKDMQASMDLVWEHLLPELTDEKSLPENKKELQLLTEKSSGLVLPVISFNNDSPIQNDISGKEYLLEINEKGQDSILFVFEKEQCRLILKKENKTQLLTCGIGRWFVGDNSMDDESSLFAIPSRAAVPSKVAASVTWKDDKTLLVNLKFIENIHGDEWTCTFDKDKINVSFKNSITVLQNTEDKREDWKGKLV
jgi:beta-lactamase family protein